MDRAKEYNKVLANIDYLGFKSYTKYDLKDRLIVKFVKQDNQWVDVTEQELAKIKQKALEIIKRERAKRFIDYEDED